MGLLVVQNLTLGNKAVDFPLHSVAAVSDPEFLRSIGALLGPPPLAGNRAEALVNGDQIFPAMLSAIRAARQSITFETYIYWSGTVGEAFAEALAERARAGVAVHVLIDWWGGEDIVGKYRAPPQAAGVEVGIYNPPRLGSMARLNARTHRKLMVVDGRIGFTGGVGIADAWLGNAADPAHWRDTHFRVEGPVVAQMQAAFMDNWMSATGRVLHGSDYFPVLEESGHQHAQLFTSAAGGEAESIQLMYLMSIAGARHSLRLSMAYFVPDELAIQALVLIVDEHWVSVGSTNFDNRSFSVNDEANLNVADAAFAGSQARLFDADLALSQRVSLADWQAPPARDKFLDALAGLLGSQL